MMLAPGIPPQEVQGVTWKHIHFVKLYAINTWHGKRVLVSMVTQGVT